MEKHLITFCSQSLMRRKQNPYESQKVVKSTPDIFELSSLVLPSSLLKGSSIWFRESTRIRSFGGLKKKAPWRAVSKRCNFRERIRWICVEARPIRIKIYMKHIEDITGWREHMKFIFQWKIYFHEWAQRTSEIFFSTSGLASYVQANV